MDSPRISTDRSELDVLVLVGSPRADGRSAKLGAAVTGALSSHGINATYWSLAEHPVAACTNCGICLTTGECAIVNDSWGTLSRHMDSADLLILVAPVYFAGPSAWLKAALDRCQMYWARRYVLHRDPPPSRPAHLLVVGEGGDPIGNRPLVDICTSALNSTGLRIDDNVHDFVGKAYDLARVPALVDSILEQVG